MRSQRQASRRDLMRTAAAAGAALGGLTILGANAKGAGKSFKVALIGCGGRGNGALRQHLAAGKTLGLEINLVATADYFKDRAERAGKPFGVPKPRYFGGAGGRPARYSQGKTALALFDLERDIAETTNVADKAREDLGDSATKTRGKGIRPAGRLRP